MASMNCHLRSQKNVNITVVSVSTNNLEARGSLPSLKIQFQDHSELRQVEKITRKTVKVTPLTPSAGKPNLAFNNEF